VGLYFDTTTHFYSFAIFRSHRLHAMHEMRLIATDVAHTTSVCLCACMSVYWSHGCAVQKRLNRSRCRLGKGWLLCIRGDQDRTNAFTAARGDKMALRPCAKLLWILV